MIDVHKISTNCTRNEFVGTAVLDTIGLVISGIDDTLLETMNVGMKYRCLGLFSSRTGAAGQITAIDDAVKATNTEVLSIELPRDTKGWVVMETILFLGELMSRMFAMPYLWLWNLRINMQVNSISARVDIWNLPIQPVQDRL